MKYTQNVDSVPEDFQDQSFHRIPTQYVSDWSNQDVSNGGIHGLDLF